MEFCLSSVTSHCLFCRLCFVCVCVVASVVCGQANKAALSASVTVSCVVSVAALPVVVSGRKIASVQSVVQLTIVGMFLIFFDFLFAFLLLPFFHYWNFC